MLKQANVSLDLKNATPEERSNRSLAMAAANKEFKQDVALLLKEKNHLF